MTTEWPKVRLGDVLHERRETPDAEALALGNIPIVSKIGFEHGKIELRQQLGTKTGMILVRPGDILLSGINAAKGAIAIYGPENTEPVAATIHYGAYMVVPDRANVEYLWWYFRSNPFREILLQSLPEGIKTELKSKRLLPIEIPLPLLPEQQRIVGRIKVMAAQIAEARTLRKQAAESTEALTKSRLHATASKIKVTGTLGDVLLGKPRNGWSARCDNVEGGNHILSLGAVTGFRYRSSETKLTSLYASKQGHFWLKEGDLLITRSNTPELVGHTAIYNGTPSPCIYPDLMMRLDVNPAVAERRFVWYWLQSPIVREFIGQNAKGTSPTMKKISQGIVMSIPFPSTFSLAEQRRIVTYLDGLQTQVDALKQMQAETACELNALLPSLLDRAFKGEL